MPLNTQEIENLLSNTNSLIQQVYWFEQELDKPEGASHRGASITYVDIKQKRDSFLDELKNTILNWVYSKAKYQSIYNEELKKRQNDVQNTVSFINTLIKKKFRKGYPQGQFGELLLYNFLQYFFSAPPLLRKMPLTTNPALERNGADAIHYFSDGKIDKFFLGESKCYESKYRFNQALKDAVESIVNTFENLENELSLYNYEDFIDPLLEPIAKDFIDGNCTNARIELACLIAYNETNNIDGDDERTIKNNIKQCIVSRFNSTDPNLLKGIRKPLVKRIHYIVFPFWQIDSLLSEF